MNVKSTCVVAIRNVGKGSVKWMTVIMTYDLNSDQFADCGNFLMLPYS